MEARQTNYLPVIFLLVAALIGLTPFPFAGSDAMMPCLALITVFYWGLLRPTQLPIISIFIAGLLVDAFAAPALGMYALMLLVMRILALRFSPRFARQTIWFFWMGFCLLSLPCWLLFWAVATQLSDQVLSVIPVLLQWGFTALWYPLLHLVFTRSLAILPQMR